MLLTIGDCKSRAGSDKLRYPHRRHLSANVFRRLEQRLSDRGSVTPMEIVKSSRQRNDGH